MTDTGAAAGGGRGPTRAQNRAAKRAATEKVRPRTGARGGRPPSRSNSTALIVLGLAAVAVIVAVVIFGNPFGSPAASPTPGPTEAAAASHGDGTCPTSQPPALAAGEARDVTLSTELGDIVIRIDGSLSPIAAGNFVALATCGFYDGTVFHRTPDLPDGTPFVIQGGDPTGTGAGGPGYTIQDEPVTATYHRGTVAMARSSAPNSQGSQFFIVLDDRGVTPLAASNNYAIFGEVVSGMDIADQIYQASNGVELPTDPIAITSVTVAAAGPAANP